MEWLNNPWTIGIFGGIFSGFFVVYITNKFFSRTGNIEYMKRIKSANNEIINEIRHMVAEKQVPTENILKALIHSTARRHEVLFENIYSPQQIIEELVKEVISSSFISSEDKKSYCDLLLSINISDISVKPINEIDSNINKKALEIINQREQQGYRVIKSLIFFPLFILFPILLKIVFRHIDEVSKLEITSIIFVFFFYAIVIFSRWAQIKAEKRIVEDVFKANEQSS